MRCGALALLLVAAAASAETETAAGALEECPARCDCLELYVDCSGKRLTSLPALPRWTERLDLAGNRLRDDAVRPLGALVRLATLALDRNRLRALPRLAALRHLDQLTADRNEIGALDCGAFAVNGSLRVLHLSGNRIARVDEGALTSLTSLVELKLNGNEIAALPADLFSSLARLTRLELNENRLSAIRYHAFHGLESLTRLELRHNGIENVTSGAFFGFKAIETLALDHNRISVVSKGWMYGLESLTIMSLSHNSISKIDFDSWELNSKLEVLDLSHNNIGILDARTFKHLKNLKTLSLNNNEITTITQEAFSHTPLLRSLQLSSNKISWTVEDMTGPFSKLHNLNKFNLTSNHIQSINSRAFEGLSKVKMLDLRGNNITSIQQHAFESMTHIKKFYLNCSTLLCDCNLQWLSKWIRIQVQSDLVTATCAYPAELRGQHIGRIKAVNCGVSPKPRVTEHPKTQKAIKGNSTHLICTATSNPFSNMTFLWRKNNVNISEPIVRENKTILIAGSGQKVAMSELIIPNVTHFDDGKYQCLVSNSFGTTYSKKAEIKMVIFPKFTKTPTNVTVRTGETVSLNCAANGDPSPEISWKKDGGNDFPAARERRMNVMPADHMFFIVGAKTEDMGVYSCAAKNSGGTITSNATLSVLEPASVNQHVEKKVVATGEEVVIQCMISGSPKPQLNWLKDGKPIVATERHFFTAEDQLLIIVQAETSDAGKYVCEANNTLGSDKGLTELSVTTVTEDMTGIIIITVVCCAVGTSVVWVVIIYQTRRRMARSAPTFPTESIKMSTCPIDSETGVQLYADSVSERSSCKDSGTGDSAKQGSFDGVPNERSEVHFEPGVGASYSPVSEAHKLLPSSFKPSIQVCVNTSVSPATYSFSSHSDKDMS